MSKVKTIIAWILSAFFLLSAVVYFPSWFCVFSLIVILLLLPPLKAFRKKLLKKWVRITALVVAIVLCIATVPVGESPTDVEDAVSQIDTALVGPSSSASRSFDEPVNPTATATHAVTLTPTPTENPTLSPSHDPSPVPTLAPVPTPSPSPTFPLESKLEIHFLDVGQGDAILLRCDGHCMLVDAGSKTSAEQVVSYLRKQNVTNLDYVVNTHAHEDHVGGLAGVMNACRVQHVFAPVENYDSDSFRYFKKYTEQKGLTIETPAFGDVWSLGNASITVLAPFDNSENDNDSSIVLKVQHNNVSFLLMGDAGTLTEQQLISRGVDISATVLKVGHHGDDQGTGYQFLREVMPQYAVISVGTDNGYGHPTEAVLSKLSDENAKIFRTDLNGNIVITSDGNSIEAQVVNEVSDEELMQLQATENESDETQEPRTIDDEQHATSSVHNYIGNKKTKKFHEPSCETLPKEEN